MRAAASSIAGSRGRSCGRACTMRYVVCMLTILSETMRYSREDLRLHDRWRLHQELVGAGEQRLRDVAGEMRIPRSLIGEGVEDAEAARTQLQRVPAHGAGLRLRHRKRRLEKCLQVFRLARSGLEHDEDRQRLHPVFRRASHRLPPCIPFIGASALAIAPLTFCSAPTPVYTTFPSASTTTRYDVCGTLYAATAFPSRSNTNSPPRCFASAYAFCFSGV